MGPVLWEWVCQAGRLPGKSLWVALVLCRESDMKRSRQIEVSTSYMSKLGIPRSTAKRCMQVLEQAGMIWVERRTGRKSLVTLLHPNEQ